MRVDIYVMGKGECKHFFKQLRELTFVSANGLFDKPIRVIDLECMLCHATKRRLINPLD